MLWPGNRIIEVQTCQTSASQYIPPVETTNADHTERDILLTLALVIAAEVGALMWFLF